MRSAITILAIAVGTIFVTAIFLSNTPRPSETADPASSTPRPSENGEPPSATEPAGTGPTIAPQTNPRNDEPDSLTEKTSPVEAPPAPASDALEGAYKARPGTKKQRPVFLGAALPDKQSPFLLGVDLSRHVPAISRISLSRFKTRPRRGGSLLFDVDPAFTKELDANPISKPLRQAFAEKNVKLSEDATVSVEVEGRRWLITDGNDAYLVHHNGGRLDVHVEPYVIQQVVRSGELAVFPFTPLLIEINGRAVKLHDVRWDLDEASTPDDGEHRATYKLLIVDAHDQDVLEIERRFRLEPASFDLTIEHRFTNRTDRPLKVVWETLVQADAPPEQSAYAGDRRFLMTGYFDPNHDASRRFVYVNDANLARTDVLDAAEKSRGQAALWPNRELDPATEMVWFSAINRYFAIAVHPIARAGAERTDFTPLHTTFSRVSVPIILGTRGTQKMADDRKMVLALRSRPFDLAVGETGTLDLALFAGPRSSELFKQAPFDAMGFGEMLVYELGCTWCTFQPLARGLLWFLKLLHAVTSDWSVAIILLVCFVRLLLHPITKKSQINMMKMGKQMQALQPEIQKLKNKYANDKSRLNQETMRLYKEQSVNPFNMLGCLPMLLQTPIWIALYAMLYTAIELRHEPAFYGIFQLISGDAWPFLMDLSGPDRFIPIFDESRYFNLFLINFDYASINIIPILMGVVFFIQQKLTMTPATTDDQRRQQKIMSVMMTVFFPLLMFSVPSGLTLYILTSTGIGILESRAVRRHIREQEEAGTLFKKKKNGGFMDRLQTMLEERKKHQESAGPGQTRPYKHRKRG